MDDEEWPPIHADVPPSDFAGGDYDFVVIGGGAAGVAGALLAAQLGAKTLIVEKNEELGGNSMHRGTLPRSTLLSTARARSKAYSQGRFGLSRIEPFPEMSLRKAYHHTGKVRDLVMERFSQRYLADRGIEVLLGSEAKFISTSEMVVNGLPVGFKKAMIATGSSIETPKEYRKAAPRTRDPTGIITELPEYMIIIGAGREAVEWAQIWRRFGSAVSIICGQSGQVLPRDDPEVGDLCKNILQSEGVEVLAGRTRKLEVAGGSGAGRAQGDVTVTLPDGTERNGSHLLIAIGRIPTPEDLGLEAGEINFDQRSGHIAVDDVMKTSNPDVYAAGEVLGTHPFTHLAAWQARVAAEHAFTGASRSKARFRFEPDRVTWATMIDPEIAHCGYTESDARRLFGKKVNVYKWDSGNIDRAIIDDQPTGFVKVICVKDVVVGADLIAPNAADLIQMFALATRTGATLQQLLDSMSVHPSFAEATVNLAIESLYDTWLTPKYRKSQRKLSGNINLERM